MSSLRHIRGTVCHVLPEDADLAEVIPAARRQEAIEAVVEDQQHKASLLSVLSNHAGEDAVLSTTTSSFSIDDLARASAQYRASHPAVLATP